MKLYKRKEIRGVPLSAMLENHLIQSWILTAVFGTEKVAGMAKKARQYEKICSASEFVIHVCVAAIATILVFGAEDTWKFAAACLMVIGVACAAITAYGPGYNAEFNKLVVIDRNLQLRLPATFEHGIFDRELENREYLREALDSELFRLARLVLDARGRTNRSLITLPVACFTEIEQVHDYLGFGMRDVEQFRDRHYALREVEKLTAAR